MAWPFKPKALKTPFAKDLFAVREDWEERVAHHEGIEEPNRVAVLSASAGATVALGAFGTWLIGGLRDLDPMVPKPDGSGERPDRVIQFAHALGEVESVEAAYRVVTWGLIAEFGAYFWRPNYETEVRECAEAFEFRNVYEGEVPALGTPAEKDASPQGETERRTALIKGTLVCMIGAAIDEPIDADHYLISMYLPNWNEQFFEGLDVANERVKQLSPEGLPIWKDKA